MKLNYRKKRAPTIKDLLTNLLPEPNNIYVLKIPAKLY